ncbi:MAG TPA: 1,2-phenylacetyl-CoA epoxidase subunit PaaD [Gemmatimonadaceae bacterium]
MVKRSLPSRDELFDILDTVKDPEVPVISIVELGIVRDAVATDDGVVITITPTYSGCPAMREIEDDVRRVLEEQGIGAIEIRTTYSPAWTTDWIGPAAREKLEAYGIAPPGRAADGLELVPLRRRAAIRCPYCKSVNTEQKSAFGSTACKAIWFCNSCRQPFEEFKAI